MVTTNYFCAKMTRKLFFIPIKYLLILFLTFSFTLTIAPLTKAQMPFFSAGEESTTQFTPWWKLGKTRVCGKLWCSDISFPYFPYSDITSRLNLGSSFTIASRTNLDSPQTTANELEVRASVIEQTWLSLYRRMVRYLKGLSNQDLKNQFQRQIERLEIKPQQWLIFQEKPLHPLTPKIEVGIKNAQTVIFAPAQRELGLSQETIVTVTEDDSIYNGKSVGKLANEWRNLIRRDLSEALWGYEFDRLFPGGRLAIIGTISILTLVPIVILTIISHLVRGLDLLFKQKIRHFQELAKQEQQASFYNQVEPDKEIIDQQQLELESDNQESEKVVSESNSDKAFSQKNSSKNNLVLKFSIFRKTNNILRQVKEFTLTKFYDITHDLPTVSLAYQNIIKQLKNLTVFLIKLLIWLRFLLLFTGLSLIVSVYPSTRAASFFFLAQAIFLPLIWMLVNLGDTIAYFVIDYYLNRWAKEAQITDPNSARYPLRVTTYSPALKGASSFLFIIIGIYLSIQLFGINPDILVGAGGVALLVGFLARNVFEDMLNGILILWTDRYAIGDIITVGTVGGFVENMNLYTTQIRGAEGCLITIPNGQITLVQNKTKDWSRVEFKIEISTNSDPLKAIKILQEVGEELQQDPDWQELILEPVNILGIDQVSHQGILIQVWIKTQPMKQWATGREYRLRVQQRFKTEGIELGIPQRQIWHRDNRSFDDEE